MAIAVIGGVISSTVLTLIVVPVVYLNIESMRRGSRRLMTKLFRLEERPDPVLTSRPPPASDRAAAE
jgi:hypothetical protein